MIHHITYPRFVYAETELGEAEAMQEGLNEQWNISYPWGHDRFYGTESQVRIRMRRTIETEENDGRVSCVFSKGDTINFHWDTYKVSAVAGSMVKIVLLESKQDQLPFPDGLDFPGHSCCLIVTRRWQNGMITCEYKDETLEEHEQEIALEEKRRRDDKLADEEEAEAEEEDEDDDDAE